MTAVGFVPGSLILLTPYPLDFVDAEFPAAMCCLSMVPLLRSGASGKPGAVHLQI
jgi:hypothetical protein